MVRCTLLILFSLGCLSAAQAEELDKASWKQAIEQLKDALRSRREADVAAAITKIGSDNSERAAETILEILPACLEYDVYAVAVDALAGIDDAKALKLMRKAVGKSKTAFPVRFLLVEVLGRIESTRDAFADIMTDKDVRLGLRAAELIVAHRWEWGVPVLIDRLASLERRDSDSALYGAISNALAQLLDESAATAADWRKLWEIQGGIADVDRPATGGSEGTVVERLRNRRPDDHSFIEELAAGDIIVVKGIYDEVELVLDALGLPYTLLERNAFNAFELDPRAVLIFNCDSGETPVNGDKVKAFVGAGGYLFTSDWELQNVVTPAFGNTLTMAGATDEHEFPIVPAAHAHTHPLLADVFPTNPFDLKNFTWHIDGASFTLRCSKTVEQLVWSEDLAGAYGGFGTVAAVFPFPAGATGHRSGAVLHVLSHFQKQTDPQGDGFALQQLLLNFIVEKQKHRRRR